MISTIEVTGNVITSANKVEGSVQTRSLSIDGEVDGVLDFETKWGEIIGDLNDQTDLKNALDGKANASSVPTKTSELENDSGFITDAGVTSFNGSTGAVTYNAPVTSVNGNTGAVTITIPTNVSDLNNDSGFTTTPPMVILSYGNSVWNDFISAYNTNSVVYCRASSNSNPATGSQNRLAFMAYVNSSTSPTEVEFQYYRSVATHSDTQQGDQVYVYKFNKTSGWSVTVREAYTKIAVGTGLKKTYSNGVLTISLDQ